MENFAICCLACAVHMYSQSVLIICICLDLKKCKANKKQPYTYVRPKALISCSRGQEVTYQRCFVYIAQVRLALLLGHFYNNVSTKRGGQVTKSIILVKICYKLLYVV